MRIFKLARRSVGLQSMAYTVKNSWQDLFLLASLIMIGMMVFGSLEYYIEMDEEDTGFYSIPQGMWWAVQTLTSLGYGDFPVQTIPGKLFGSMCAVSGVLVLALPIPIVVDNFADYYKEQKQVLGSVYSAAQIRTWMNFSDRGQGAEAGCCQEAGAGGWRGCQGG